MKHVDESLLNEYLDEVLKPSARRAVDAHLRACQECSDRLDDLRMVFAGLSLLAAMPLARDLTPGILERLPGASLPLGWKLALAVQAGVAMGLLGAIGQAALGIIHPMVDAGLWTDMGIDLVSKVSFSIPAVDIPSLDLSGYSLPFSAPVTVILLVAVVILWGLGNARLLRNGHEVQG
jgi:hypothetical protein